MAENFNNGERVQVVDELGRWAEGKVQEIDHINGFYVIKFRGYSEEDNVRVCMSSGLDLIRKPEAGATMLMACTPYT